MTEWTPQQTDDLADFGEQVGIAIATGLVPFLGQAIDIYDTAWAAHDLYATRDAARDDREEAYFSMAMALIGWIPGPGDGIKKTLQAVNKNPQRFAPLMLDVIRQALYAAGYKVDPYQFLMDSINEGEFRELLNNARQVLARSSVYRNSPALVQQMMMGGIDMASNSLPLLAGVVERKVKKWLHTSRRSTAETARTPRSVSAAHAEAVHAPEPQARKPPAKQQGNKNPDVGRNGEPEPSGARRGATNAKQIAGVALTQAQESIGEHVADYHCHDQMGWGRGSSSDARHDRNQATSGAKLSDQGRLRQLSAPIDISRGQGLDAVWRSRSPRPYAITEYKARMAPMAAQGVRSMLINESVQDASQKAAHRQRASQHRREQRAGLPTGPAPTLAKDVPKMSHMWIQQRVHDAPWLDSSHKDKLRLRENYSRHVILVVTSVGDGKTHAKELADALTEGRSVDEAKHTDHGSGVTVFGEAQGVFTEAIRKPPNAPQSSPNYSDKQTGRAPKRRK